MGEITSISAQSKDKTRCNVYVDGKFSCALSVLAVMQYRLKVGMKVDDKSLEEIQLASEKDAALSKAVNYVTATQKTKKQVRDYLRKKGYLPVVIHYVLEKMTDYRFLDDSAYATTYCGYASQKKGKRLIRMELRAKGVSDEDMTEALGSVDEEQEKQTALTILQKYLRGKGTDKETLQKGFRHLLSKGFDYDVAKAALSSLADLEDWEG